METNFMMFIYLKYKPWVHLFILSSRGGGMHVAPSWPLFETTTVSQQDLLSPLIKYFGWQRPVASQFHQFSPSRWCRFENDWQVTWSNQMSRSDVIDPVTSAGNTSQTEVSGTEIHCDESSRTKLGVRFKHSPHGSAFLK